LKKELEKSRNAKRETKQNELNIKRTFIVG